MKRNPVLIILAILLIYFSLFCYAEDVQEKENRPVLALEKLGYLIVKAIIDNDSQRLEQIKNMNGRLIRENKFLMICFCNLHLSKAIKEELSGRVEYGIFLFQISQVLAEMYKNAADSKYLLDKVGIFRKWIKEEKEKYRNADELYDRGEELSEKCKYYAATDFYDKSLSLCREIGYKEGEANCLTAMGEAHRMLGEYEKAGQQYKQGLKIYREINDRRGEANNLHQQGELHRLLAEYEKAVKKYEKSLEIFQDIRYRLGEANCLTAMGEAHQMLEEHKKAGQQYKQGLKIYREINYRRGEAINLHQQGELHRLLAEYEKAVKKYEKSLEIFQDIRDRLGEANCLRSLGHVYIKLSEDKKAREWYEKGLLIYSEIKHRLGEAYCLQSLGHLYTGLYEYKKARKLYEKSLRIFQLTRDRLGEANCLRSLGHVYLNCYEYKKARKLYKQGLLIYSEIKHRLGEAYCLRSLGDVHWMLAEYEKSRKQYEQALSIQEKIEDRQGMLWSYYSLGQTFEALKKYAGAEENYKNSIRVIEEVWEEMKVEEHKSGYFTSKVRPYESLIALLFKLKKGDSAFPYAERSKARAFLYLLGNKRISPKKGVPLKMVREEEELRQKITLKTLKIKENEKREKNKQTSTEKLAKELLRLKQQHTEIVQKIKLNSPEYASFVSVNPLDVEKIQALIQDEENVVILEYYTTPKATYLWLLDGKKIYPHKIDISEDTLKNKIKKYHTMVSNTTFGVETFANRAQELYNFLLKPVELQIKGKKRICIIPHGNLHYLPFETLMNKRKFLVQQNTKIFYLPSASAYKYCKDKNRLSKRKIIALGNPDGTLPHSEKEVEEIKRFFQRDSKIFTGKEAKESRIKDKKITSSPDIFHFACHGTFDSELPLYSYLKLAEGDNEDGRLETQEIFDLQLKPAYLVTLSACQTHLGGIQPGDEIIGLTRAFIYAGTSGILASLWKVDDYYTEKFMVAFYRALTNSTKIDALHTARQTMIRQYGKKHPFYWAAFVLIGDPR